MPGNSAHTSMFFQARATIKFRFPPHSGCDNETSLQWKRVCTKSKYLTPSSALVKLLGKISLGKETSGEVTRMAGGCRWQPGLHVTHPPLLVLAAGLGRPLTEMSSSGIY